MLTTMTKASKVLHLQPGNLRLVAHLKKYRKFAQAGRQPAVGLHVMRDGSVSRDA